MSVLRRPWALAILVAVGAGCAPATSPTPTVSGRGQALLGGDTLDALPFGSAAERAAFARIEEVAGTPRCTATLIGDRFALTAGHCFALSDEPTAFDVARELDALTFVSNLGRVPIVAVARHPELDVAVVTLGVSFSPDVIAPAALSGADDGLAAGDALTAVGGGAFTPADAGVAQAAFTIDALDADIITLSGPEGVGLCPGDSGGAYLSFADDAPVLVGVHTDGNSDCSGPSSGVRLAAAAAWVAETLAAPTPALSDECEGSAAACDGAVAETCIDGTTFALDCAIGGYLCELEGGEAGCVPTPCGEVTPTGACEAGVARRCEFGSLVEEDCATLGLGCDFLDDTGRYGCRECTACDGVCTDLSVDPLNCGSCGNVCIPDGRGRCVDGACAGAGDDVDAGSAEEPALDGGDADAGPEPWPWSCQTGAGPLPWWGVILLTLMRRRRMAARA